MVKQKGKTKKNLKPSEDTLNFIDSIINQAPKTISYRGISFNIKKNVLPFERSSQVLAEYMVNEESENVLDMGSGSGIQAIIAYKNGAKKVVAVDIDENSINNIEENIKNLELENKIKVIKSDLFDSIPTQKFDKIIANLPFTNCDYDCEVSHLLFDPGYKLHEKFFDQARNYLSENGKIILVGGDLADEESLYSLIDKYGYKISKETIIPLDKVNWKIYEICKIKMRSIK